MLFKSTDIKPTVIGDNVKAIAKGIEFDTCGEFCSGNTLSVIESNIGALTPGKAVWFMTDGAWSNYELLEYILKISGPAEVCFTTWAISEVAINRFITWKASGMITELNAVIDVGLRNRKPAVFQQAVAAFPNLSIGHIHAKATVVISGTHHITLIGSANYTKNPRKEVGAIFWDENIALANAGWIKEEVYGRN